MFHVCEGAVTCVLAHHYSLMLWLLMVQTGIRQYSIMHMSIRWGSTWNLGGISCIMVQIALIQRVRWHPRVQSRSGTAWCQRLLFDVWRYARWTPVWGRICIRRLTVQRADHRWRGLQGAAAAVRAIVRIRGNLTCGHVGWPGAWWHMWDVMSPSESLEATWHRVTHQVYVVAVVTR